MRPRPRSSASARSAAESIASRRPGRPKPGSRLEWAGEFGELQDAIGRLVIVVPLSLGLHLARLLFLNPGSQDRYGALRRA